MAGIDPQQDARGARWEHRLHVPVLAAAWLAVPTVFLYFSDLTPALEWVAVVLSWAIWAVFLAEAAVMLSVVADRRAWIRGHLFGVAVLVATFPLLTHILEGLLAARALSTLQGVRVLQVLYLAKAAKLIKSMQILRRKGRTPRHPVANTGLVLVLAAVLVGIGHRIVTKEKDPTPLHGTWEVLRDMPHWSLALTAAAAAGLLLAAASAHGRRRRAAAERA